MLPRHNYVHLFFQRHQTSFRNIPSKRNHNNVIAVHQIDFIFEPQTQLNENFVKTELSHSTGLKRVSNDRSNTITFVKFKCWNEHVS